MLMLVLVLLVSIIVLFIIGVAAGLVGVVVN